MKKIILTVAAVLTFGFANAQSNEKGTIHLNLLGGLSLGSGVDKFSEPDSPQFKYKSTGGVYGLDFQYGLADNISAGVGLELGAYVFTPKDLASVDFTGLDYTMTTFKVTLGGRYYIVNSDDFNFFAGPKVGYISGKDALSGFGLEEGFVASKYSGINVGLNTGINYYFTEAVGGIFQLGYDTNMTSTEETFEGVTFKTKRNFGGLNITAGLALKF